ncbi:hypothetical protein BC833DRAFT_244566 [Globomyces pollinis-pini]|nr:hypothetical protein BC833DRAFT_244566 [Globomyces pollinis-pini]
MFNNVTSFKGTQVRFNAWLLKVARYGTETMMKEYIRLTNIAFGVKEIAPPVFLLDEIQTLCRPTNVLSSFWIDGTPRNHSRLSLLLTQLAGNLKPVCICTGTNSGNIISIEKAAILPQVLSLTPLVSEYGEFWTQLTAYSNRGSSQHSAIKMDADEDLINALVYASYQIPRLLWVAHSVWFDLMKQGTASNREFYIQAFELEAINYYGEMVQILETFTTEEVAHILLACGVHWTVKNEASNVPGTTIPWVTLIQKSVVFPYLDGCYLFPFTLVWRVARSPHTLKEEVIKRCAQLIPNLDVRDLFISFDTLCSWEIYNLGVGYETLFSSSLAVKYYLRSISTENTSGYFSFPAIYDISHSDEATFNIMSDYEVNFSHGISLPTHEVFTNADDLGFTIVNNRNIHDAHHDLILPARTKLGKLNIAVQAKASLDLSDKKTIAKQLLVSPDTSDRVQQLFLLYLGETRREQLFDSIVFLDGSGCCNGLALDFIILVKKLRSANQK